MKLLLCVEETGVMLSFTLWDLGKPTHNWHKMCCCCPLGWFIVLSFSIRSLITHVTVKTVYYILISETALSRGCVGTYVVVVLRLTNPHHHCTLSQAFPRLALAASWLLVFSRSKGVVRNKVRCCIKRILLFFGVCTMEGLFVQANLRFD